MPYPICKICGRETEKLPDISIDQWNGGKIGIYIPDWCPNCESREEAVIRIIKENQDAEID